MRHTLISLCALLCLGYSLLIQAAEDTALLSDSPGRLELEGLSEYRFHPLTGTFRVIVEGVRLGDDPASLKVLINDVPLESIFVSSSAREARVNYRFRPGLNEIQVTGHDRNNRYLQTDALVWAGLDTLAIDVMTKNHAPVNDALVVVALAQHATVESRGKTAGGSLLIGNLPSAALVVTVRSNAASKRQVVPADAAFVLVVLDDEAENESVKDRVRPNGGRLD